MVRERERMGSKVLLGWWVTGGEGVSVVEGIFGGFLWVGFFSGLEDRMVAMEEAKGAGLFLFLRAFLLVLGVGFVVVVAEGPEREYKDVDEVEDWDDNDAESESEAEESEDGLLAEFLDIRPRFFVGFEASSSICTAALVYSRSASEEAPPSSSESARLTGSKSSSPEFDAEEELE